MEFSQYVGQNLASLQLFYPEIALTATLAIVIIVDLIAGGMKRRLLTGVAVLGLLVSLGLLIKLGQETASSIFSNMLAVDPFSFYFKLLFLATGIIVLLLAMNSSDLGGRKVGELTSLIIAVTLGMFLLASSTNLLTLYIALELTSIPSYILAGYLKRQVRSSEASLKYVIYGAFSSGLMLYGFSLLYGLTGALSIYDVQSQLAAGQFEPVTLFVAVLLIFGGFGYKIAAVPFHFWAPDVYEGAPTAVTAFLSVGPKAAGFAALIRFFNVTFGSAGSTAVEWSAIANIQWPQLLAVVSALTMTLGNLLAINQTNVKRLLAYSSIAHAGYTLMGIVLLNNQGVHAMMFYLVVYYFMNLGAFLVVIINARLVGSEDIDAYDGLGWRAPLPAIAMAIFLFSLTGLPVSGGFVGKFYLFAAVISGGKQFYWLVFVAIMNSVVSLYYYARILKAMFLNKPANGERLSVSPSLIILLLMLAIPTLLLGVYWAPLADFTSSSVYFLRGI